MRIGILGDGQLALMLGEAAQEIAATSPEILTVSCYSFGQDPRSSFASRFPSWHRLYRTLDELIESVRQTRVEVLILENEFFTADELRRVEREASVHIFPNPDAFEHFESKENQRKLFARLGIASPEWKIIGRSPADASGFPFPAVLKTLSRGYDGYGVRFVDRPEDLPAQMDSFKRTDDTYFLLEERIRLKREFAEGVLLDGQGGALYLPCLESQQIGATCGVVYSRWEIDSTEGARIRREIRSALERLSGLGWRGLFNFEFLESQDGRILMNEGAPRPHNSAHLTINASPKSQFRILVELALGRSLAEIYPQSEIPAKNAVMINLLGKRAGPILDSDFPLPPVERPLEVEKKYYGKTESRPGRKLGHAVIVDPSEQINLRELVEQAGYGKGKL